MLTADLLRNISVFSGLSDEHLANLAEELRPVHVPAGEWIVREGEAADSMFIIRSGRVEVIDEGPPEVLIRTLRRGDVLGELALLRQSTRSASVRARRDTDLLELSRAAFEALIQHAPSFALGLTRVMGAQLAASHSPALAAAPPRTIAVVSLDANASDREVAEGLAGALRSHGSVAALNGGDATTIDQAERDSDRVVLSGGCDPGAAWTDLCVREADLIVAVTTGTPSAEWQSQLKSLHPCELLVFGPSVSTDILKRLQPQEVQVIAEVARRPSAWQAMARRFAGRSLGIVLSGGGARAMAHLGVIEELQAAGLCFDRTGGVSLGALVAAATAQDIGSEAVYEAFVRQFGQSPTNDYAPPVFSLIRGAKTRRLLAEAFGDLRIEELPLRFFCLSCDLISREPVLHRAGPVVDAIYSSLAIPGVFPPVATPDGRLLVDGGVLDNLPVATMARTGEGPVIAVDVTGRVGDFTRQQRPGMARLGRPARRALTGNEAEIPRLGETIVRTVTVGSSDTVTAARQHAALVITPSTDNVGLMDWGAIARVRDIGRRAAQEALAADPDLVSRLSA